MPPRPTGTLAAYIPTVFAAIAIVVEFPCITEMFGFWLPLIGGLLFALVTGIATGKWSD